MKIQAVALLFLFAVILSAPLVAVPADLVPAMAALDKIYIPVLGLSGQAAELARALEGLLPQAGLAPKAAATYAAQWQASSSVLEGVKGALEAGDEAGFTGKLGQLKPNFIKTFFLFGDFPQ